MPVGLTEWRVMSSQQILPAAVLWDFDGTLMDSEPLWMEAEFDLIPQWGGRWTHEDALRMVGNSLVDSAEIVRTTIGRPDLSLDFIVDSLVGQVVAKLREGRADWCPGARELLLANHAAGIPQALVSASYRVILSAVLDIVPEGVFSTVVAGDEVTRGKPDPESYLTACTRLGVDPADVVVLEDSVPGCASGNAAGARVIGVRNHVAIPPAPNRVLVDTLVGLRPESLLARFPARAGR